MQQRDAVGLKRADISLFPKIDFPVWCTWSLLVEWRRDGERQRGRTSERKRWKIGCRLARRSEMVKEQERKGRAELPRSP